MTIKTCDPSICVLVLLFLSACSSSKVQPLPHPESRKSDQVDVLHGVSVPDPYRWLEDLDSPETKAWVEAQNGVTRSFLEKIPARESIRQRLEHLWNYAREGAPFHRGNRWFQYRNDGLQDHAVLYWSEGMEGKQKVLLDPNQMSQDGSVSLAGTILSEDGRYIAYALSEGGSDWSIWRVRDIATGRDLDDRLEWVKFSGATWAKDGSGFWYARYPQPEAGQKMEGKNLHQKLYFHRLGEPQAQDQLVYERPDEPEWGFGSKVTEDGEWLIISAWLGTDTRNRVFLQKLTAGRPQSRASSVASVRPLITSFDGAYDFIACSGTKFWFRTDAGAPKSRVIEVPVLGSGGEVPPTKWRTLIAETEDTLDDVRVIADRFIVSYQHNAYDRVAIFAQDGKHLSDLALPGIGTVGSITGRPLDREMFFVWTSFTSPGQVWRFNFDTEAMTSHWKAVLPFNPDDFTTEQVWFKSKDGTQVPMFLTHRNDVAPNGKRPTYLYAYGGFNVSLPPAFSVRMLAWMEMGGVFAQANLRGGGEFGEAWHKAGMLGNKQNVYDDFIAAAEHLIDTNWTEAGRLAIGGGSNGGLLVGACMVQRPELFGACLPAVGVMDMLRFHKFTIGWAWEPEYGSPDNPEHFPFIYAYSPLHNLTPGTSYPPTMITTADHDDRVVPAHSFKFAAALQAAHEGPAPMLIRIETKAGHGAGVPTSKQIEEAADRWAFLAWCFDMPVGNP